MIIESVGTDSVGVSLDANDLDVLLRWFREGATGGPSDRNTYDDLLKAQRWMNDEATAASVAHLSMSHKED
jgi:hypothetical protein